jgi:hypothetical protein
MQQQLFGVDFFHKSDCILLKTKIERIDSFGFSEEEKKEYYFLCVST